MSPSGPPITPGALPFGKKASQSSRPQGRIKTKPVSTPACAWMKTLLRLQVWGLSASSGQALRAADCTPLEKVVCHFFDSLQRPPHHAGAAFCVSAPPGFPQFPGTGLL